MKMMHKREEVKKWKSALPSHYYSCICTQPGSSLQIWPRSMRYRIIINTRAHMQAQCYNSRVV